MADKFLIAWLIGMGLHLTFFYLFVSGKLLNQYPWLLGFEKPFPLIHGPFLFLYTSYLTNQVANRKLWVLHFLPILICSIPLSVFLFSSSSYKLYIYSHQGVGYEWYTTPMSYLYILSGIIYVTLSLIKLFRHQKNITNVFSNIDKINLAWLRNLIFGLGIIWLVVIYGDDKLIYSTVVIYIIFIGYFGIRQTSIFSHGKEPLSPQEPTSDDPNPNSHPITIERSESPELTPLEKTKYEKSSLNESDKQMIHDQLTDLMQREKLYTNPEITLGDVAQKLNIHPNHLSQVINSISKKNFYDYINSQRVEEFNRSVQDTRNQKYTLLSLAHESGFNSKTSFNRNFRKVTGLSPSEYLRQRNLSFDKEN